MEIFPVLRNCKVFADFNDAAIARLAISTRIRDVSAGEAVVGFGQRISEVGVVASGSLEARYRTSGRVVVIQPGHIYGEVALLNGEPAIADVVARSAGRILIIPFNALTAELARTPAAAARLASLVVRRLAHREEDPEEQMDAAGARAEARSRPDEKAPLDGRPVLVLNCGSSSVKYACFAEGARKAGGIVERIGASGSCLKHDGPKGHVIRDRNVPDAEAALRLVLEILVDPEHGAVERLEDIAAVGHRTVHGGDRFTEAVLVDDEVKEEMRLNEGLAPLHNPANLKGIEICERLLPNVPQVAVFDTAFHLTMPEHAWRYAIPRGIADRWRLRRYGFHGTSHKYVTGATGRFLGTPASALRIVSCHLGNGASVTAVDHGRSVDTSMGLTPLEGLVMGTRPGDLDPGLVLHLLGQGMTREAVDELLNRQSGLLGLSGLSSDMRELEAAADAGHSGAILAIRTFCYRVRKYVGAYAAVMGGLDALVFTGGIGENDPAIRALICQGLGFLGIRIDDARNAERAERGDLALRISPDDGPVHVLVVPTDEEGTIVVETDHALDRAGTTEVMRNRRDRPIPIGVSA
ncbi:MAG: acetate/propionate family kinase, partial [Deltaproteobacteria bacterium]|nr:acetate/propionate family kinase [Deltaproteobacteria bacterium]